MPALDAVFAATAFVGGPEVAAFEQEYAAYTGVDHCVGVANGTDALELALRAAGVRPGSEVIIPANTFIATAEAVSRIGAVPVPVDVDDEHLLIDPVAVAEAITASTSAVVAVHLFGQLAPLDELAEICGDAGIALVEDAAQSQGAHWRGRPSALGDLGQVAATSFYPGKNLGAAGDAGAVTTADPEIAARVRLLANHGSVDPLRARRDRHELATRRRSRPSTSAPSSVAWTSGTTCAAAPPQRYDEMLADVPGDHLPRRHRPGGPRLAPLRRARRRAGPGAAGAGGRRHRRGHPLPDTGPPHRRLPRPGSRPRHRTDRRGGRRSHPVAADVPAPDRGHAGTRGRTADQHHARLSESGVTNPEDEQGAEARRSMRILVHPPTMEVGGSQLDALELAREMQARGHSILLFGPDGVLVELASSWGLEYLIGPPNGGLPSLPNATATRRLVRDRGIDVVHGDEGGPVLSLALGPHLTLGTPLVATVLSMSVPPFIPRHVPLLVGTAELANLQDRPGRVHLMEPPIDDHDQSAQDSRAARRAVGFRCGRPGRGGRVSPDDGSAEGGWSPERHPGSECTCRHHPGETAGDG